MKKYKKILLCVLIIVTIALIPAIVSAYYVPVDDDEYPDSYYIYEGKNANGDLEDVLYNDGDEFHIEGDGWRLKYVDISFTFDWDLGPYDVFSVYLNVDLTGISTVEVWINGDDDGWFELASISSSVTSITIAEEDRQGVLGIRFKGETKGWTDFSVDIDHAVLNFTF